MPTPRLFWARATTSYRSIDPFFALIDRYREAMPYFKQRLDELKDMGWNSFGEIAFTVRRLAFRFRAQGQKAPPRS
jgi:hypothetical protein